MMGICDVLKSMFSTTPVATPRKPDETWLQVVRRTDRVSDDEIKAACEAVEYQVREQLAPAWWGYHGGCVIEPITGDQSPSDDAWWISITDDPDTADALGYHDTTAVGKPQSKVFVLPSMAAEEPISAVISHEVCEMVLDPLINQWAFDLRRYCYAMEAADAVQGHSYDINGVTVADFVTARFFDPLASEYAAQGDYDHMGVVIQPFQTMPTGWQLRLNGSTVEQVFGREVIDRESKTALGLRGSRRERRKRGHRNWRRSVW